MATPTAAEHAACKLWVNMTIRTTIQAARDAIHTRLNPTPTGSQEVIRDEVMGNAEQPAPTTVIPNDSVAAPANVTPEKARLHLNRPPYFEGRQPAKLLPMVHRYLRR